MLTKNQNRTRRCAPCRHRYGCGSAGACPAHETFRSAPVRLQERTAISPNTSPVVNEHNWYQTTLAIARLHLRGWRRA